MSNYPIYGLPLNTQNGSVSLIYRNRGDFRVILDIFIMLADKTLEIGEKTACLLMMIYENYDEIEDYQAALNEAIWFISGGENEDKTDGMRLVDWEKDFKYIIAPVNKVLGIEARSTEYLHWWTFLSAYYEIGESTFTNIVGIRYKLAKGKPLTPAEREYLAENRDRIEIGNELTEEEKEFINSLY